jgi:protein SCO1/2
MPQQLLRRLSLLVKLAIALLCTLAMPTAQAHSGHLAHEHQITQASGGDFTLTAATGPVALKDFRGKVVVIYFGYTHCTDICPLALGKLGSVLTSMEPEEVAQIQPLFITVDPARDDAKQMATYSSRFHPKLIGLTGSEAEIAAVAKAYGIHYEKGPVNAAGGYEMGHSSAIYLMGRNGKLLVSLPYNSSPARFESVLRKALRTKRL